MDSSPHSKSAHSPRRMRCTIIGAGVSGILIAYKLKKYLKNDVDFDIFEKNPELGGTWYENRYPGCACDVPSHCYQYSFAPNPNWSKFFASAPEINSYLKGVANYFDLEKSIHYNSKVVSARWSAKASTWTVDIENGPTVVSDILINASGILNNAQLPALDGLSDFSGPLLHTAAWDPSINLRGKRIGIIGSGASAVQVLPQLQPLASQIQVYIRTPSWICPPMGLSEGTSATHEYDETEMEQFRWDDEGYLNVRKNMEGQFNSMFRAFQKSHPEQTNLRTRFETRMRSIITDNALQDRLIPSFEVGCRRISPGEGFLRALQEPNVEPVFGRINKVTADSVELDGVSYPTDVLVAATGFNTTFRPRFPIIGLDDVNLQDLWAEDPVSYMGLGVSGFPNYLIFLGPNTPISNGSAMGPIEATSDYFIRIIRRMIRRRIKSFNVQSKAQKDFDEHTQSRMRDMVWTGTCHSWFKKGVDGKVTALWPGSSLHYMQVLAENRWEDFDWEYEGAMFDYWGGGFSWIEDPEADHLGIAEHESWRTMTTIPHKGSDLSYYLWKSQPIPKGCIPPFRSSEPVSEGCVDEGVFLTNTEHGQVGEKTSQEGKSDGALEVKTSPPTVALPV